MSDQEHQSRVLSMEDGKGNFSIAICHCGYESRKVRGSNDVDRARNIANKHANGN